MKKYILIVILALSSNFLTACTSYKEYWNVSQFRAIHEYAQDIPLPGDIKIDISTSFILLVDNSWIGKVTGEVESNPSEVYRIYKQDMPVFGWTLMADIQGMENMIVYEKKDKIAIIKTERVDYKNSSVFITVLKKHNSFIK